MLGKNGNEIGSNQTDEFTLTDDTNLLELPDIDNVLNRDDIDLDKFIESSKVGADKILWKDVKISSEIAPEDKSKKPEEEIVEEPVVDTKEDKGTEAKAEAVEQPKTDPPVDNPTKTTLAIDEAYIKSEVDKFKDTNKDNPNLDKMVEDYQGILNGVRGEVMSPKAFKNYINSQMYIKQMKPSPLDTTWKPDTKVTTDPDYLQKALVAKNKLISEQMRRVFRDFPDEALTNPETEKEFLRELMAEDPRAITRYDEARKTIEKNVNESYDKYVHLQNNWETIARDSINVQVAQFNALLSQLNLTPEDLALPNLSLDDKYYNEFLYKNVIYDKNGKPNENVIGFLDGKIPVIKPNAVYVELVNNFAKTIISKAAEQGRKEGFEIGKTSIPEPSMSDSPIRGEKQTLEVNPDFLQDDSDLTPEQLENKFQSWKQKLFNGKRK